MSPFRQRSPRFPSPPPPFTRVAGACGRRARFSRVFGAFPLVFALFPAFSAVFAGFPGRTHAQTPTHAQALLSPHARRLLHAASAMGPDGMAQQQQRTRLLSPRARLHPDAARLLPLRVHVRGGAAALTAAGFPAHALSPSVAAVDVLPSELPRLRALPGVLAVDGARALRPVLDRSRPILGADVLGDQLGVRGAGVMVTIVDTGIDFRHPDFRTPEGRSRIAFLVDASQARRGTHPELPPEPDMAIYTAADIDATLAAEAAGTTPALRVTSIDDNGHGTHVAGIAAGNGRATGKGKAAGRYVGIAPEATICAVKGTRDGDGFADADILDGVRFCLGRAAALRMPTVVNLSLGSLGGPHDGSSTLEIALDEIFAGDTRPSRALVVASGNDGESDVHASASLLDGTHEIPVHVEQLEDPQGLVGDSGFALELYYEASAAGQPGAPPGTLDIELVAPGGKVLTVAAGGANRGTFAGDGVAVIDNSDTAPTGLRGAIIVVSKEGKSSEPGALKTGDWTVRLRGRTLRYDLWLVEGTPDLTGKLGAHLDPDGYIEIPAAARSAISVGAMRSRADWTRVDGKGVLLRRELGRVATFSSGGPTRDGRFAPDVLAPGEFIASSLSSSAPPGSPRSAFFVPGDLNLLVVEDGVHAVLRGTSQAAPHVSGAVALLFQLDPDLPIKRLRELLRTTARGDASGNGYGPRRGFGTLALEAVLRTLRGAPPGAPSPNLSDVGVSQDVIPPGVGTAIVTVTPRDALATPLGAGVAVEIATSLGEWTGPVVDTGYGRYERTLRARGPLGARATLTVRVQGVELTRKVTIEFANERSQAQGPYVIGGCGVTGGLGGRAGTGASAGMIGAAMLAAAASLVRRRNRARRLTLAVLLLALAPTISACAPGDRAPDARPPAASAAGRKPLYPVGGEYYMHARDALTSPAVTIRLREQRAEIRDGAELIAATSVCTGRGSHKTPPGTYKILEKLETHTSSRYGDFIDAGGEIVQAGVDNLNDTAPAGSEFRGTTMPYFMRILGGIGLHAGPLPGYADSHGCIRLPPPVAERLFALLPLGTPVTIVD